MKRLIKKVSATAAQAKRTNSSGTVASGKVQKLQLPARNKMFDAGYDTAIRNCAEALLREGDSRDYIAYLLDSIGVPFPTTDDTIWDVSWAYDDWDAWVAGEETENYCPGE